MAEPAAAHVTHRAPGRIRLRFPAHRGDVAYMRRVANVFSAIDGVEGLDTNPRLGSALVRHSRPWPEILADAEETGLFAVRDGPANQVPEIDDKARAYGYSLDGMLRQQTGGAVGLGGASVLALFIIGLVQLARGNVAAPAITLFWYAAQIVLLERIGRRSGGDADPQVGGSGRPSPPEAGVETREE